MKNVLVLIMFAALLGACASSPKSGSTVADAGSGPKTKRVCDTVRSNQTGVRLQRVCREVVVEESDEGTAEGS